ncbi:MAG: hypothetical protein JSW10_02435 [Pseudomonadota bacterium]|nr:MAG: hypothetical protein JSW10_02435 [Pseudomonadota bacterium]
MAVDPDPGDTLIISAYVLPNWLTLRKSGNGTATLAGTPRRDDVGEHPVVLRVTDSGSPMQFATQTFVIRVSSRWGLDDGDDLVAATTGITDTNTPEESMAGGGGCWTIVQADTLVATLPDEPELDAPLRYTLVTQAVHGTVAVDADGQFSYVPLPGGARERDSFGYRVEGAAGGSLARTATVIIAAAVMPLGDSIATGIVDASDPANPLPVAARRTGYRGALHKALIAAGYGVDFVGSQVVGLQGDSGFDPDNEGHESWSAAEIALGAPAADPEYPNSGVYHWLTTNSADVVLLHIGTDVPAGSVDGVAGALDAIDRFEADMGSAVTVILARIIDRNPPNAGVSEFNAQLDALAAARIAEGDNLVVVDQQRGLWNSEGVPEPAWYGDEIHPNATGYARMADVWFEALAGLLDKCP